MFAIDLYQNYKESGNLFDATVRFALSLSPHYQRRRRCTREDATLTRLLSQVKASVNTVGITDAVEVLASVGCAKKSRRVGNETRRAGAGDH